MSFEARDTHFSRGMVERDSFVGFFRDGTPQSGVLSCKKNLRAD